MFLEAYTYRVHTPHTLLWVLCIHSIPQLHNKSQGSPPCTSFPHGGSHLLSILPPCMSHPVPPHPVMYLLPCLQPPPPWGSTDRKDRVSKHTLQAEGAAGAVGKRQKQGQGSRERERKRRESSCTRQRARKQGEKELGRRGHSSGQQPVPPQRPVGHPRRACDGSTREGGNAGCAGTVAWNQRLCGGVEGGREEGRGQRLPPRHWHWTPSHTSAWSPNHRRGRRKPSLPTCAQGEGQKCKAPISPCLENCLPATSLLPG